MSGTYAYISLSSAMPLPMAFATGDPPGPGRVHEPGASDERVGPELQRVEELVVHPPVDDVNRHLAVGRPEEDVDRRDR